MLDRPPSMLMWMILAASSGIFVELARRSAPEDFRSLFLMLAVVLAVASGLCALDWLLYKAGVQIRLIYEVRAHTERVMILERIATLNDRQVAYLESNSPQAFLMPGSAGPMLMYLRLGDGDVPFEFLHQFLELSDDIYLAPVGTWTDGSKKREWAQLLTSHLVLQGFASKNGGNKPARWIDKQKALVWLGMEDS